MGQAGLREGGITIDILQWVDQLEALLTEGWRVPLSSNVVVNENAAFEIIDQMRIHVPEELKQARRVQQQQDRIIAQAKEEANRIKSQARQEADAQLSQHEQVVVAQAKADQIMESARNQAEARRQDADQYALQVLRDLEASLEASIRQVRNGIKQISAHSQKAAPELNSPEEIA